MPDLRSVRSILDRGGRGAPLSRALRFSTRWHRPDRTRQQQKPRPPSMHACIGGGRRSPLRSVVARCRRCISADRRAAVSPPPTPPPHVGRGGPSGEARARTATSASHAPLRPPRGRRRGGGWAWGSCGRSGRHALGRAAGASCVQKLDDSRNSAIHTTYRISLRSSSLQEPRYPLLRVVATCFRFPPEGGISVRLRLF